VEGEEPARPTEICLLGADGVVTDSDFGPHAFEQPRSAGFGRGMGDYFHGCK
jgi:hypothetical protein